MWSTNIHLKTAEKREFAKETDEECPEEKGEESGLQSLELQIKKSFKGEEGSVKWSRDIEWDKKWKCPIELAVRESLGLYKVALV